jgi:hypothetical protein
MYIIIIINQTQSAHKKDNIEESYRGNTSPVTEYPKVKSGASVAGLFSLQGLAHFLVVVGGGGIDS